MDWTGDQSLPLPPLVTEALFYQNLWQRLGVNPLEAEKLGADRIFKWLGALTKLEAYQAMMARLDAKRR